jgi:hypothetical protein
MRLNLGGIGGSAPAPQPSAKRALRFDQSDDADIAVVVDGFAGGCDDRGSAPVPPRFIALGRRQLLGIGAADAV